MSLLVDHMRRMTADLVTSTFWLLDAQPGNPVYEQQGRIDGAETSYLVSFAIRDLSVPIPAFDEPTLRVEDV